MAESKPFYVLDTSVILKWFFQEDEEPYQQEALALQADYFHKYIRLAVPEYCFAEILNIFGRKFTRKRALAFFSNLLLYNFEEYPVRLDLVSFALEIMEEFSGVSFYDTGYHALALLENGVFVTADEQYFSKTRKKGRIMLLKDYGK